MIGPRKPVLVTLTAALGVAAAMLPATAQAAGGRADGAAAGPGTPVASGRLRITGTPADGGMVAASGLRWRPGRLPAGDRLLSFEVGYVWRACLAGRCSPGAGSTATPFAARRYVPGHADTGHRLMVTETATEVVKTAAADFTFVVRRARRSVTSVAAVAAYPRGRAPASAFVNGLPEARTGSDAEYFQVAAPHFNPADGPATQRFRIDGGRWHPMPASRVFYTGRLRPGPHRVRVLTADRAGRRVLSFRWRVVPLPAPARCHGSCWYPPHLNAAGRPLRWDWQIGRTFPLQRTGPRAVDLYDIDGFLTTRAAVHRIRTRWQAATLPHPRAACYLDLAWEDYRPDATPSARGGFPAAALGRVYYGYPQERWVDFRQLDALKPMLRARIAMCARKGFDAVELDDIDSFDPPSTTGFYLTAGDAQNYLAYAFNLVHAYGMTALWKNNPSLARWGVRYTDGAVVEECYLYRQCGAWHVFAADKTAAQPTGKWVGEAEYGADHFVCDPGQRCRGRKSFAVFCRHVYSGPDGFAAVKFDVDLNGRVFFPCPSGR
ncbi:MAG TPA: endo alpha-1,4 polygalactosaminidase [Streptosporangiaceae bacterium]